MKFHKIVLFCLFAFFWGIAKAQSISPGFEIQWDEPQDSTPKGKISSNIKIIKATDDFIFYKLNVESYGLATIVPRNFLVKYNRKTFECNWLDLSKKKEEDNTKNKLTTLLRDTIGNMYHCFSYFHNKAQKKLYVFDETFDYEKLLSNNDIKCITEIDLTEKGSLLDDMFIIIDNGRILLRYACKDKNGKYYGLEVFNCKMEKEWSCFSMAETQSGYNLESGYKIDNEGNVYAIQRNFARKSDVEDHFEQSRIWAVCYPKDGSGPKSVALTLKDNLFATAERLSVNKKNQIVCAGLFAKPGSTIAAGAFSFVIEPKLSKILSVQTKDFSKELLDKGLDSRLKNKTIKKIYNSKAFEYNFGYVFNDIYYRRDGSFDVVAEQRKSVIVIKGTIQNQTRTLYNFYDNLWVLNFNADGSFKWVQKIPKYEYVVDNYSRIAGYYLFRNSNEELNFVYNIALYKKILGRFYHYSTTALAKLDNSGNETIESIINDNNTSKTLEVVHSYYQNNGNIILTKSKSFNNISAMFKGAFVFNFGELKMDKSASSDSLQNNNAH